MALQKTPGTPSPVQASTPIPVAVKPPVGQNPAQPTSIPFWVGLTVSIGWVGAVVLVIAKSGPVGNFGGVPLVDWALGVSAAVSPVAMVWMITAYLQRAADIQTIADPLRRQLTLITGESGAADARIRRFNQAIREQLELLRNAQTISQDDMESIMERVRQHRGELERFESVSTHQVKDIQEVIRRSMLQVEQMMDDKFTMLRVLDGKLQQNGDGVARQVEGVRDQVSRMLQEVEGTSAQMADALERVSRDSKKLSDTSRLQESSLTNAAEAAAETLGGLSSKIDLSVAKFLERASSAREEAERLASVLDAQTRALDDFSGTLPVRVSEAEAVLRGVADRLYASEKMASDQAVHLSEKLSQQVDGLQGFMDRFTVRMSEVDSGLDRRHSDLNNLSERIGSTTTNFVSSWEKSLTDLNDRTGNSLLRFTVVNDETRRNADAVAQHLTETTSKYEDVVIRMRALSSDSSSHMKGMTEEIARNLAQFESLGKASSKAGEEVQLRASAALQNLQHVLERVLTAREATQAVGETLVQDIYAAVDQNEKMITRLSETAQLGARTLGAATEALGRQEGELIGKARAGEAVLVESVQKIQAQAESASNALREQTGNLMNLLAEAQSQLVVTDQKLQSFATHSVLPVQKAVQQIDASADLGLRTLSHYGEGLDQQVARLQDFHTRIGGMSEEMGKATTESVGAFEQLCTRFTKAREEQGDSVRHTMAQFSELSDRMQREVVGLDGQTARAVEVLQQAALKVGEQSYQMLENAQNSGAQMKDVAAALQSEAAQIQTLLRKQNEDIGGDLVRAEQRFTLLGETIRERADAAYILLDRAATHYGEVSQTSFTQAEQRFTAMSETIRDRAEAATVMLDRATAHYSAVSQTTAQDIEERTQKMESLIGSAQGKVDYLSASLAQQAQAIDVDATKIEAHATEIAATSGRAMQNLSALNEKLALSHDAATSYAQSTLTKLEETTSVFERRTRDMTDAADAVVGAVAQAGSALGEQTGKLVDSSHQIDGVLRQLTSTTGSLVEQAAQIRVGMEQQNSRLLSQLADSVAQMDVTGSKMQHIAAVASQGADQVSARFIDMTDAAAQRMNATTQDLHYMAERTESTLAALGVNITQQAASLSIVGEQIGEQQRLLAVANESQRMQMTDLFDQLGSAHKQASEVAERSISYLTDSLEEVHRQMGLVGDRSQETVGSVKMASIGFSEQATMLIQNAQAAEHQARTVLSVTAALQDQARHLRESLQDESTRAGDSLGNLLNRLTAGSAEIRDLGVDTGAMFATLQRAIGDQTGELGNSMQQISDRQRTLTASLDAQREVINGLLNRLILAQDETAAVAESTSMRLTDGTQQIIRHVETLDARAQAALQSVQVAASGFAHEAEGIETQARQAEQQSRAILASASGAHEQIHDLRTSMQSEGERTQVMLDSLLDKVTMGAAEMRDLSAATEMSLTSLGNNVTQQSSALGSAMQQIGDRQRNLAVTLDGQRDTVNGLLNRLTLAQDETALVAERTATRINDSTQQIVRQVDVIGAQATTTLASIQASITGFSDQAGALNMQGQQAEQQMRGVLSVTSGMQEQARHLREAMQVETAHVVEQLSGVIAQLDATNRQLKTESGTAMHTLDQTARQFAAATKVGTDMIRQQTETLGQAAEQSEARIGNAGEKLRNHMRLVGDMGTQAETQARQLADTAEFATTRLVSLRDTLTVSDKDGRDIMEVASERITDVRTALQGELHRLSEMSQQSVMEVAGATQKLAAQSEILRANLATSEAALSDAASLMREESAHLPGMLNRNATEIETVTRALKGYAVEADQSLIGTADRFISVTAAARGNMIEEMQRVSGVADEADKVLRNFNYLLAEQVAAMQQSTAMLSSEQKDLIEKAGFSVGALAAASDRLSTLRGEAATTAERLSHEFDLLDQRATTTSGRLVQASESVARQMEALNDAASRAEGQIGGAGDSFRDQLERIRAGMQGQIDDINRGLMQITAQLERTGASLRSTTVGAVADVERIGLRFEQTGGEAAAQVNARTQQMRAATDEVSTLLARFDEHFDTMIARMMAAGHDIRSQEGDVVGQLQTMLAHLGVVAEKLDAAREMSGSVSQHAIDRLDDVVNAVQAHMNNMSAGAQTAAGVMRGIGQIYNDQTQGLVKGVGDAHSQVLTMNKSIDDMQQRTDRMRASLKLQGDELMGSLRQILTQLEMTGDGLSEAVDRTLQHRPKIISRKWG